MILHGQKGYIDPAIRELLARIAIKEGIQVRRCSCGIEFLDDTYGPVMCRKCSGAFDREDEYHRGYYFRNKERVLETGKKHYQAIKGKRKRQRVINSFGPHSEMGRVKHHGLTQLAGG